VSPVLHDEEPEPPSIGRGVAPQATEDRSVSSFLNLFGPILRASPSSIPVGQSKGKPFYGQVKGQLCPTWQSYAGLPPEEGACVTGFPLVSPMLHGVVPEPPSIGRGVAPQATEDRGVSSFLKFSLFLRASPSFTLYFTTSHPRRQCIFPKTMNHEPRNQKMALLGYIIFL